MKVVNSTPNELKENLDIAIQKVIADFKKNYYTYDNHDFQRNRALTMEKGYIFIQTHKREDVTKEI